MKSFARSVLLAGPVILAGSLAHAAFRYCEVDPDACPNGEHLHCVTYGWTGDESTSEDSCDGVQRPPEPQDETEVQ